MTNYEWLTKNNAGLVKHILSYQLSKVKGVPSYCLETMCVKCDFGESPFCSARMREWLDEEHEPDVKVKE